eukprot:jgi/Ulvmu1/4180/UM019_0159.1
MLPSRCQTRLKSSIGHAARPLLRIQAQNSQSFRLDASSNQNSSSCTPEVFRRFENLLVRNLNDAHTPGARLDWASVAGCWTLRPPDAVAEAVVVFVGDAFVGAAPELAYKLLLESLAARNVLVIAVPYATHFDNQRLADELQHKSSECLRLLSSEVAALPVYAMGHGMGSLLQLLMLSKHSMQRDGSILLSYYNRPAVDVIPFLSPMVAPGLQGLGGAFSQLAASPLRSAIDVGTEQAKNLSPTVVKMILPLFEQLNPVVMDIARGQAEWYPSPRDAQKMISTYYSTRNNLLIQFQDDEIDQTPALVKLLKEADAPQRVRLVTLEGGHNRPALQNFVDLPRPIASMIRSSIEGSSAILGGLSNIADDMGLMEVRVGLKSAGKQVGSMSTVAGGVGGGPITDSAQELADEMAAWMGVGGAFMRGGKAVAGKTTEARSRFPV